MTDIDLKTLTPDTSLPTTGFLFGADSQATASPSVYGVTTAITTILGNAASSDVLAFNSDTIVLRDASNTLAQRNGVNAQTFNLYGTYTDASTYERLSLLYGASNDYVIAAEKAGTGSFRQITFITSGNTTATFDSDTVRLANNGRLAWTSTGTSRGSADLLLTRKAAANLRFGAADAAAPVAQTLSVQSVVSGTAGNVAGANFTITGSQGTGTGAGGSLIFQVAPAGSTATFTVTFTNGSATISGTGLPSTTGTAVAFTTTGALPTNFAINTTYFVLAGSTSTAITVAATAGGTAIVAGSAGSGTQTLTQALAQNALATSFIVNSNRTVTFNEKIIISQIGNASGTSTLFDVDYNGVQFGSQTGLGISWGASTNPSNSKDIGLYRDTVGALAQRQGTQAQEYRVYETTTGSIYKAILGNRQLIKISGAAFDNGAGASAGTMTNAPTAGNPTKWIPIDDNGTTRYIPAW